MVVKTLSFLYLLNIQKIINVSNAINFALNNPEEVNAYLQPSNIPVSGFNNKNLYQDTNSISLSFN